MIQITNSKDQLFKKSGILKTTTANTVYSAYLSGYAPYSEPCGFIPHPYININQ